MKNARSGVENISSDESGDEDTLYLVAISKSYEEDEEK